MERREGRKRGHLFAVLAIFVSLASGCGIESYPYLEPPELSSIIEPLESELRFRFTNYAGNNINYFEGYEVYYKFYSAAAGDTTLTTETSIIDAVKTREKLLSYNYRRFYSLEDSFSLPLIRVDTDAKKTEFTITIDFSELAAVEGYGAVEFLDTVLYASRYVKPYGSELADFYPFVSPYFDDSYEDFSPNLYSADNPYVYLVLYVMAYGRYDLINDIYSRTASLGRIRLKVD